MRHPEILEKYWIPARVEAEIEEIRAMYSLR